MLSGLVQNLGGLQFSKPQPCKTSNAVDEGNVKMYNTKMQMWITIAFQAHYIEAEKMRGRPLGAVGKYR